MFFATAQMVANAKGTAKVHCEGVNSCKGKGACNGANNGCKGQTSCRGNGWIGLSAKKCKPKVGTAAVGGMDKT